MRSHSVLRLATAGSALALATGAVRLSAQPTTPASVGAQSIEPKDAADSAAAARANYRTALDRLAVGDSAGAVLKLRATTLDWPTQPAYANALLTLATRMHDSAQVEFALSRGNVIGVALAGSRLPATRALVRSSSAWSLQMQDSLRAPVARSTVLHTLNDSLLFPEGATIDARSGALYVSSIFRRNIFRIASSGITIPILSPNEVGVGSILGIAVDSSRNLIWAASVPMPLMNHAADSSKVHAALLGIRMSDGKVVRRFEFPVENTAPSPGDLALAPNGDVFVADAATGILWQLKNKSDSLIAIRHHLFHSLQGIVPSMDGSTVWVADYSVGLLRVDLQSHEVTRVADARGQTSVGLDGLVRFGDSFVGVQNAFAPYRVVQIMLDASGTRITKQTVIDQSALATSPTGGTVIGNKFVYVANSLWEGVGADGLLASAAAHPKPLLLSIPLTHN